MGNYLFSAEDKQDVYTLLDEAYERETIEMYENKNIFFYCKNYLDTYYNDSNSRGQTLQEEEQS